MSQPAAKGSKLKWAGAFLAGLLLLLAIVYLAYPRPNFVVDSFVSPGEVYFGGELVFKAELKNLGQAEGEESLTLFIGDEELSTRNLRLDAGEKEVVEFSIAADFTPGKYNTFLGLGPEKIEIEEYKASFRVLQPFEVEEFAVPEEVLHGENPEISASLKNAGQAESSSQVTLFLDDREVETREVVLAGGETKDFMFQLTEEHSPGDYTVSLGLGPEKVALSEWERSLRIVRPAEFVVEEFSISADVIDTGEEIEARVRVANIGEVEGSYYLPLMLNEDELTSKEIALEGGEEQEVTLPVSINTPGSHTLAVEGIKENITAYQIERPANGRVLVNKVSGGSGELNIRNNRDLDNLFVLSDPANPQVPLLAVYLRAGSSTTVSGIADGIYEAYFSFGTDFDTHSKKFTKDSYYGRFEEHEQVETVHMADGSYQYTILEAEFDVLDAERASRTERVSAEDFPSF